ncbi:unnamed protein product [Adineta ricciae]|uniref:G-protein coupled receptors family 1 profile domain-containing protein n=1 Tax=Adineta ricciae TaxID=249248 RepID=A0A813YAI4_ADIRI|nr:unnamed protein product [Adineta ricciae]CAF1402033.1 unnamed protein product [Adineta ricciae]
MNINDSGNESSPDGGGWMGAPPPPPPDGGGGGGGGMGPPPGSGSSAITSLQRNVVLYGYLVLFIFGFFGHSMSFTIFRRQTLRKVSTSTLFVYMTISDLIYLLACFYTFIFLGLNVSTANKNMMNQLCRAYSFVQYFCMCCTAWFLLTITIDRWLRIRFPFRVRELCTRQRVTIGACVIVIVSAALNSHLALPFIGVVGDATVCSASQTSTAAYQYFYSTIWPILITILQIILPTVLLLAFSISMFVELRRQQQQKTQLRRGGGGGAGRRVFLDRQMLLIMISSIVLFFITQIPLSLFYILMTYVLRSRLTLEQLLQFNNFAILIASIDYAASFYVHCLSSRLFRQEFYNVIRVVRSRRVGVVTQLFGPERIQTQTQLVQLQTRR